MDGAVSDGIGGGSRASVCAGRSIDGTVLGEGVEGRGCGADRGRVGPAARDVVHVREGPGGLLELQRGGARGEGGGRAPETLRWAEDGAGGVGARAATDGLANVCEAGATILGGRERSARSASSARSRASVSPATELSRYDLPGLGRWAEPFGPRAPASRGEGPSVRPGAGAAKPEGGATASDHSPAGRSTPENRGDRGPPAAGGVGRVGPSTARHGERGSAVSRPRSSDFSANGWGSRSGHERPRRGRWYGSGTGWSSRIGTESRTGAPGRGGTPVRSRSMASPASEGNPPPLAGGRLLRSEDCSRGNRPGGPTGIADGEPPGSREAPKARLEPRRRSSYQRRTSGSARTWSRPDSGRRWSFRGPILVERRARRLVILLRMDWWGFEPQTSGLQNRRSSADLPAHGRPGGPEVH